MKIISKLILLLVTSVLFGRLTEAADINNDSVTAEDLGISQPLVLPTNPFYFLKEFKRGVQKTFTFGSIKKLDFELKVANEKITELKKLEEIVSENPAAVEKALDNYQSNFDSLSERIKEMEYDSQNERLNKFISDFTDNGLKHLELFFELKEKVSDKNQRKINDLQNAVAESISQIFLKLEKPEIARNVLAGAIKGQRGGIATEFRLIEILSKIEKKLSDNLKNVLRGAEENSLYSFQSKIEAVNLNGNLEEVLTKLPLDAADKIRIFDELREIIIDSNIKNSLNIVRQDILDTASNKKEIRKQQAEEMIAEAENAIQELKNTLAGFKLKSTYVNALSSKSDFNLKQAKDVFNIGNYGQSFGQASAALAAARAALIQAVKFDNNSGNNLDDDLKILKEIYDNVAGKMKQTDFNEKNQPDLFNLLLKSEKSLAALSDLINKNLNANLIISASRTSKILLFRTENKLNELIKP